MPLKTLIQKSILSFSGNKIKNPGLEYYVAMMKSSVPFSFSRYGDGEWNAMLNIEGANCDGHEYFPQLGEDLRRSILNKGDYFYGLQPRAVRSMRTPLQRFFISHGIQMQWHDADVFHDGNKQGKLYPLIAALRLMDVVLIGPGHLRAVQDRVFPYKEFLEIPSKNCYLAKEEIKKNIRTVANGRPPAVFAFSASMTTKTLIFELFPEMGGKNWLIDFGSLWDIYVGVKSRNVYSKRDWTLLIEKNLNGRR